MDKIKITQLCVFSYLALSKIFYSMKSLVQFFEENVDKYLDSPYMWEKRNGAYQASTYKEMR